MLSRVPIIVILGATGTGKSKLAIEIATKFGGEIVSADSMQVYRGLDIITNKVTAQERADAPHHMLDLVDPPLRFSVVDFRNRSLRIIEDLLKRNKLPVVVGGTNYYIESLLWHVLVEEAWEEPPDGVLILERDGDEGGPRKRLRPENLEVLPSPELHRRLAEVDPVTAASLHPNNRRRIIRALQVFGQHGRPLSAILRDQRQVAGGSELGGPLRFPHSCILWLQCDKEVLNARLDSRVDDMLERGLMQELLTFHHQQRLITGREPIYTEGIYQSIGFKEFHQYLVLTEEEQESAQGKKLFAEGVTALKLVTRRYARRQMRWINNRFLRRPDRQVPPVYGLDTTDPSRWEELVNRPALHIVESFLKGSAPDSPSPLPVEVGPLPNPATTHHCTMCDRIIVDESQWEAHLKSKKHKKKEQQRKMAEKEDIKTKDPAEVKNLETQDPVEKKTCPSVE